MDNEFDMTGVPPIQRQTIAVQVAERILALISTGQLKPGDRLPPERELATRLGVGRTSVREALRHLTMTGLLESKRGSGTFVSRELRNRIVDQIDWSLYFNAGEVEDLFVIRRALEVLAARLAAEHATAEENTKLAVYRELGELSERDISRETDIDLAFHEAITYASHNQLLIRLVRSLRSLLKSYIQRSIEMRTETQSTYREHQAIFEAIEAGDPDQAAQAMDTHLATAHGRIRAQFTDSGSTETATSTAPQSDANDFGPERRAAM